VSLPTAAANFAGNLTRSSPTASLRIRRALRMCASMTSRSISYRFMPTSAMERGFRAAQPNWNAALHHGKIGSDVDQRQSFFQIAVIDSSDNGCNVLYLR
jgi:hypothetical protein